MKHRPDSRCGTGNENERSLLLQLDTSCYIGELISIGGKGRSGWGGGSRGAGGCLQRREGGETVIGPGKTN